MAYTTLWATILNLLGTRDADEIDDASREARAGLEERFNDIIWGGAASDPWKIKVPGVNVDGTQNMKLTGPLGAVLSNLVLDASTYAVKPNAVAAGGVWICSLPLPRGSTLKAAIFNVSRKTIGATVTCKIVKVEQPTGSAAPSPTVIASSGGLVDANIQAVNPGAVTEIITQSNDYFVVCEITGDGADVLNSQLHSVDLAYYVAGVTP